MFHAKKEIQEIKYQLGVLQLRKMIENHEMSRRVKNLENQVTALGANISSLQKRLDVLTGAVDRTQADAFASASTDKAVNEHVLLRKIAGGLRNPRMIEIIKAIRDFTDCSLRQAVDIRDLLLEGNPVVLRRPTTDEGSRKSFNQFCTADVAVEAFKALGCHAEGLPA